LSKLKEIEEFDDDARVGRVLRLAIFCAAFVILAGFFTYSGVKGFASPISIPSTHGSVEVGLQASGVPVPAAGDGPASLPVYVDADFLPEVSNYVEYHVIVPSEYAGKRYPGWTVPNRRPLPVPKLQAIDYL
jgi:hypothetical protein